MVSNKGISQNNSLSTLLIPSKRLVTMSVSLRTPTVLCCLIIQVLNTKSLLPNVCLMSVHSNLEPGLVMLTRALVHSNLSYTVSLVEAQSKSDVASHAIPILSCALL